MNMMDVLLAAMLAPGGTGQASGGSVVPVSGQEAVIRPAANHSYSCGVLTSLTLADPPADGSYCLSFTSGEVPTDCSFPDSIRWPKPKSAPPLIEANTHYEIHVRDSKALWACREVSTNG